MVADDLGILAVDDSEGYRELYSLWLPADCEVRTAADGPAALEELDGRVDVVLLDREMPGPGGVEVAEAIEASAHNPFVVMVSSLSPDFDLIEHPVDEYVQKPVEEDDIMEVVQMYRTQQAYLTALDDLFGLTQRMAAIEAHESDAVLADSEAYARLEERVEEKRREVHDAMATAQVDWETTFRTCTKELGTSAARTDSPNGLG